MSQRRRSRSREPPRRHYRRGNSASSSSSLHNESPRNQSESSSDREEINTALELYKKLKRERAQAQQTTQVSCRPLNLDEDFPNYKRKLVVQFVPATETEEDIMNYFYEILARVTDQNYTKNPIIAVEKARY